MSATMVERELEWFREQAPAWPWKWATTFEGGAEHAYVIKGRHLDDATYERAARIIHGAGTPRKFYRRINIELHLTDLEVPYGRAPLGQRPIQRGVKFWLMSHRTSLSKALNIAPVTAEYGRQDAPSTAAAATSLRDLAALDFDDAFERTELASLAPRIRDLAFQGNSSTHILDLGARAGAAVDLGLASSESGYTAVEASRGLMHSLLFKHSWVRDIHLTAPEDFLASTASAEFKTVVALFGSASYLKPETISQLVDRAQRLVLMHHAADPDADLSGETRLPGWASESRDAARALPGVRVHRMGDYQLTIM